MSNIGMEFVDFLAQNGVVYSWKFIDATRNTVVTSVHNNVIHELPDEKLLLSDGRRLEILLESQDECGRFLRGMLHLLFVDLDPL
jgi:hypothetical protein